MDSQIIKAYQTVLESQTVVADEDEESGRGDVLNEIAEGLKKILETIENYKSGASRSKNIKMSENPEDVSWIPSLK